MGYPHMTVLDAKQTTEEILTPAQFVKLTEQERVKIKEATIVAPKLGDKKFGGFLVRYKNPIYKVG